MMMISEKLIDEIKLEGERAYPNECCGIIFGRLLQDSNIKCGESLQSISNSFDDGEKYRRFLIKPEDMMRAERFARKNEIDIVGFYHSHPDCEAVPSEYDRSNALPVYSYIIVSVENGTAVDVRSWELTENVFYSEKLYEKENV
jgi:proteasome lid subunit RPN8/RPN11